MIESIEEYEEGNEKKGLKLFLSFLFFLLVVGLLVFYWFIPIGSLEFIESNGESSNFSISNSIGMQFYENMRFPDSKISYNILDCPLKRINDMEDAFNILGGLTDLSFYPVNIDEEISISCQEAAKVKRGLFIAGEGGPSNITRAGEFNVITNGQILLLKDSSCTTPNVAIHELLHALGFDHSTNKRNIMYNVTNCGQTVGEDTIQLINELYKIGSLPDLVFENVSAKMNGRYLDTNVSIRNNGLKDAGISRLKIYADGKFEEEIQIESIILGYGRVVTLSNVRISQRSVEELEYVIESDFTELDKKNNRIKLKIKAD